MFLEEKVIPFEVFPSSCFYRNSWKFLQHLSCTLTSARSVKVIILARKNAKDLQDGGRFPKRPSMQWVSFLTSSVRGRFKTKLQPCRWKRFIKFCGRYLYFSFTCMIRAFNLLLSYIEGKHVGCWLLVLLTKFGCSSNQTARWNRFLLKKNSCVSRSMKRPALQEFQPPYFLLICTQTPVHWHPKLPIKWYGSNCLVCFEWESAVPFVQKKLPKIPFKWYVSTPSFSKLGETRSELEWSNGVEFSGYCDYPEF